MSDAVKNIYTRRLGECFSAKRDKITTCLLLAGKYKEDLQSLTSVWLGSLVCDRHMKVSCGFEERILGGYRAAPLQKYLSKALSHHATRDSFTLLPLKNTKYRSSVLLTLSRMLVDRTTYLGCYLQGFLNVYTSFIVPLACQSS